MNPPPTAPANARPPTWRRRASSEQVLAAAPGARIHRKHCWWLEPEAWGTAAAGSLPATSPSDLELGCGPAACFPPWALWPEVSGSVAQGAQATKLRYGFAGGSETAYGLMLHGFQRVLLSSSHMPSSTPPLDSGGQQTENFTKRVIPDPNDEHQNTLNKNVTKVGENLTISLKVWW